MPERTALITGITGITGQDGGWQMLRR